MRYTAKTSSSESFGQATGGDLEPEVGMLFSTPYNISGWFDGCLEDISMLKHSLVSTAFVSICKVADDDLPSQSSPPT